MIPSAFEVVNKQLRREAEERTAQQQAGEAITPQHAACEGAVDGNDDERAREQARRVQHEADPLPPAAPEVAEADLDKTFRDASPGPGAYPAPSAMSPGRGPVHLDLTPGHAAPSPGYQLPATFSVPRASLNAADFRRGPITEGHAAPSPSHLEGP